MTTRNLYAALVMLPLFSAMPAFAMKGIDAARSCESRAGCKVIYDNSGGSVIVIVVDGTTIVCPTPQDECAVWTKTGGASRPAIGVDGLLVDPGKSGGSGKPVIPGPGGMTIQR